MKLLFHLGHPAHFHLFKNVIKHLQQNDHQILVTIKKKDILEELVRDYGIEYKNILPNGRKDSKTGMLIGILKQSFAVLKFSISHKPDLLIGSTPAIAHVGKLLGKPSINLNEDDAREVMAYARITYPFCSTILSPTSCDNGKWNSKTVKHTSYHELAYLHPNHFTPDIEIVKKYISTDKPYFILRFSQLNAYHDDGVSGIDTKTSMALIALLEPHGQILITSEKPLTEELEKYRIGVPPLEIHHFLAFAKIYIGDSQTMAAEAGVLGTPFIRVNDFVGKLGYLNELENKYQLGFGILPKNITQIFPIVSKLLSEETEKDWEEKKEWMLSEKVDFAQYLVSFIENYHSQNIK
jgi:hypothetical protein